MRRYNFYQPSKRGANVVSKQGRSYTLFIGEGNLNFAAQLPFDDIYKKCLFLCHQLEQLSIENTKFKR